MGEKPFDPTLKAMVEVGPIDWTVFAGERAAPTRIIDADIATVSGAADKVLRVEATLPYLLHLEFTAGHYAADLPSPSTNATSSWRIATVCSCVPWWYC